MILAIFLLPAAGSFTPAAAQELAAYYQITDNTGEWSYSQFAPPAAISGNGQRIAYRLRLTDTNTIYLANSNGSGAPQKIDTNVYDKVMINYDGSKIIYSKTDGKRLYLNGADITPCVSDPRISEIVCLEKEDEDNFFALSGNGEYVFLLSRGKWQCTPYEYHPGQWTWKCAVNVDVNNRKYYIWRVSVAGGEAELWSDASETDALTWDLATDYYGAIVVWSGRSITSGKEEVYASRGGSQKTRIFVGEDAQYGEGRVKISADGNWVIFGRADRSCSGEHHRIHIFRNDGGSYSSIDPYPYPEGYSYWIRGVSEDGTRILFESDTSCQSSANRTFLVNRDGSDLTPVLSNTDSESEASTFSFNGQNVGFFSDADVLGNGNTHQQVFVLKGPAVPDLSADDFTLDPAAVTHSGGKYIFPLDVTMHNTGENSAADFQVRFSDNDGWSETRTIGNLAADASTVLHLNWDITNLLNAGKGKASVKLTVTADPDNIIVEASELNNTTESSTEVDARPQLTQIKSGYRPGTFLAGAAVPNNFDVWVDWNGDLSGSGDDDEPKEVVYDLNGAQSVETVNNPAAAPAASHTYDMGGDLQTGANVLHIQAENSAGFQSDKQTITLHQADNAAWLASVAMETEADPPDAEYDKIAVYKSEFEWPNETLAEYFDVPANKVNVLKKEYGPSLDAWSLGVEFRSDGSGEVNGSGGFEGEIKGMVAMNTTISAAGAVRATDQLRLTKLEGNLRGEGEISTPRVPLSPWLPFLYAQAKIGAGADATLGVYEQANGELEWGPLILGLDATVEGTISSGWENIAYVEGGVGGQPRGEFNLPPDPDLLRSLTIRLYAWGKGQFLIWEKGYDAEYVYVISESTGQMAYVYTRQSQSDDWHLSDLSYAPLSVNAVGPQAMDYAYADPALSIAADDTMTLLWVDDEAPQLEIRTSRWNGSAWSATADVSDNAFLDAHPDAAYYSAGNVVALWSQVTTATLPADPHDALADMEIVSAVWNGTSWSAPTRLTDDALMDFRPKVEADRDGNVMALWLKDADNSFPLYPDEDAETLGGDLYYTLWNGSAWLSPTLALSGISSNEVPQFARNGDAALTVWSQDADGSVGTITDTAIYYANWISPTWGLSQTLSGAGDSIADSSPRIAYDSTGQANLIWVKERVAQSTDPDDAVDQLYFATYTDGAWSTPALAVEADALLGIKLLIDSQDNMVALWLARSDVGVDLWYAVYDRNAQLWSDPILFTHDEDAQTDYDAVIDSADTLRVVLTGRELITATHTISDAQVAGLAAAQTIVYPDFGEVRPAEQSHALGRDLTMTNLVVSPTNPAPGSTAVLTATAHNSGDLALTGAQVAFYDGDPDSGGTQIGVAQSIASPFRAGATSTVSIQWDVPADDLVHIIYAVGDPTNSIIESIESNNQISLTTVLPDLSVDWARTSWGGDAITVTANIRNTGVSPTTAPFNVTLRADDPISGATVVSANVSTLLAAGQSVTVTLAITNPTAVITGSHTGWIIGDAENAIVEADESNNKAFTALNVLSDLTLTAADIDGSGPVIIAVHNIGLTAAPSATVAVYQNGLTGSLLYSDTVGSIAVGGTDVVTITLAPGDYALYVHLDPGDLIAENDESNNLAVQEIIVPFRIYLPLIMKNTGAQTQQTVPLAAEYIGLADRRINESADQRGGEAQAEQALPAGVLVAALPSTVGLLAVLAVVKRKKVVVVR
ncbi:MAG: hypothetical protein KKC18_03280 [Chloroflexi bacterium]|nr:hypothetical protein [Chloroflexota bacterium]